MGPFFDDRRDALPHAGDVVQRLDAQRGGGHAHRTWRPHAPEHRGDGGAGEAVPDTHAGQREPFAQGPNHHEIRQSLDQARRRDARQLEIRLIDDDHAVAASSELFDEVQWLKLAGRIVGITQPGELGVPRLLEEAFAIQAEVDRWHGMQGAAGHFGEDGEHRVGRAREHHFGGLGDEGPANHVEDLVSPGANRDAIGWHVGVLRDRLGERSVGGVGVLVQGLGRQPVDRRAGPGERIGVEADHLVFRHPGLSGDLGAGRLPFVGMHPRDRGAWLRSWKVGRHPYIY